MEEDWLLFCVSSFFGMVSNNVAVFSLYAGHENERVRKFGVVKNSFWKIVLDFHAMFQTCKLFDSNMRDEFLNT